MFVWLLQIRFESRNCRRAFQEDLYHRLAVILIKVPALNDRRDDIPMLISHFADKIAGARNAVKSSLQQRLIC
jgi:DNA-binding NtrC family response regulator